MPDTKPKIFHAIRDGLTVPSGAAPTRNFRSVTGGSRVLSRGEEVEQQTLIDQSADRFGESAFSDLSEAAQKTRWGVVYLRAGTLESDTGLVSELIAEAEAEALRVEQARVLQQHRYGRRSRPLEV